VFARAKRTVTNICVAANISETYRQYELSSPSSSTAVTTNCSRCPRGPISARPSSRERTPSSAVSSRCKGKLLKDYDKFENDDGVDL
jgi:hypothetical protein